MQVEKIVKIGDSLLLKRADRVDNFGSKALSELIELLFHNMQHHKGVGLAAPQIGVSKSIFVYGFEKNERYPTEKPVPLTVLINPEILAYSEEKEDYYEGCLSVPHIRGKVPRPISINYKAYDFEGKLIEKEATGFEARIIQHETDHLNGILYPMKMTDMSTLFYLE
jgi:peptide deformylase